MKICMIGAGYVGLVSAACFSEFGWAVHCIDTNQERLDMLNRGECPIYEPGLDDLMQRNMKAGRLQFSGDLKSAASEADVIFIAVGTPMRRGDGHADMTFVHQAVADVAPHLSGFTVITTKSTVPVGTSREIEKQLRELRPDGDFAVCSNPEFLREGSAIIDFTHPDRVLIGTDSERAAEVMRQLYQPLSLRSAPVMFVSRESAELAKYAANAFLAMKISFINEVADLCEKVGADVKEVASAVGKDGRIGDKFLHPGPGYGGSCFPKDVSALIKTAQDHGAPLTLIEQVETVNDTRKRDMARRVIEELGGNVAGKSIGVFGVTFKPNTDDMREAPSLYILPALIAAGAKVRAYDPEGMNNARGMIEGVDWCDSARDAANDADAVVVVTEWNEFRGFPLGELKSLMGGNVLVDLRNIYAPEVAQAAGFQYRGIGR